MRNGTRTTRAALLTCCAVAMAPQGAGSDDAVARASELFGRGEFAAAQAAFGAVVAAAGDRAPAALAWDLALTALRAGDLPAAATALDAARDRAAAVGDAALLRRCAFLAAHVAATRGRQLARLAQQPEAEPFVFERAIAELSAARTHWIEAAVLGDDWPAARRNAERAQRQLDALRLLQQQRRQQDRSTGGQQRPLAVPQGTDQDGAGSGAGDGSTEAVPVTPDANRTELDAAGIEALFAVLREREQQKLALRRAQRQQQDAAVERDW